MPCRASATPRPSSAPRTKRWYKQHIPGLCGLSPVLKKRKMFRMESGAGGESSCGSDQRAVWLGRETRLPWCISSRTCGRLQADTVARLGSSRRLAIGLSESRQHRPAEVACGGGGADLGDGCRAALRVSQPLEQRLQHIVSKRVLHELAEGVGRRGGGAEDGLGHGLQTLGGGEREHNLGHVGAVLGGGDGEQARKQRREHRLALGGGAVLERHLHRIVCKPVERELLESSGDDAVDGHAHVHPCGAGGLDDGLDHAAAVLLHRQADYVLGHLL
mmetsp:Transcript_19600/g.61568  ORF Transcript_19600/g.61568 Transcript_19600/m.61568 type:complete len:275 (-) Transcript_19600:1952-2776(-)